MNGKYYDSDQDSGAVQAKKTKYYALLAMDVESYLTVHLRDSMIQMKFSSIRRNGGFTDTSTIMDENGNEKDLANNPNCYYPSKRSKKKKNTIV